MGQILIVGSGIAGHRAAAELSRLAPDRRIVVVGAEQGQPYDRPPLSKDYLLADEAVVPPLGPSGIYGDNVVLRDGVAAQGVDAEGHKLHLADGSSLDYDTLLLATGSRLRRMEFPGVDARHIHYLRTVDDARRLRLALAAGRRVAIIGGGFIGLEVAAAAETRGCQVTLFERAPTLLSRGSTPVLGAYLAGLHALKGVRLVLGTRIDAVEQGSDGVRLQWVGGDLVADALVVGIGVVPNVELALSAGVEVGDGVMVDQSGRTSKPGIFAAGEVTNYPIGRLGVRMRTESWSAASIQAEVAARAMLGQEDAHFAELPWFWSDQYNASVQCVGLPKLADRYLQIGEPSGGKWLQLGLDGRGELVGAEAVNMGREISALRRADRAGQAVPAWLLEMALPELEHETGAIAPEGTTSTGSR